VIGRPILYRTSKDFLMRFGLGDVDELPSLKEFEALAREALGTDDGIAFEAEASESEPLADVAAPEATTGAGLAGVSGETPAPASSEAATPDSESRSMESPVPEAKADADAAEENASQPADRAAKQAGSD
jgi:segregation and condensation protein B